MLFRYDSDFERHERDSMSCNLVRRMLATTTPTQAWIVLWYSAVIWCQNRSYYSCSKPHKSCTQYMFFEASASSRRKQKLQLQVGRFGGSFFANTWYVYDLMLGFMMLHLFNANYRLHYETSLPLRLSSDVYYGHHPMSSPLPKDHHFSFYGFSAYDAIRISKLCATPNWPRSQAAI